MLGAQRGGSSTLAATVIYVQNVVEKIRWNTTLFANFNALFLTSDAEHIVLDLIIDISFNETVLRACHVYATKRATDTLRNGAYRTTAPSVEHVKGGVHCHTLQRMSISGV